MPEGSSDARACAANQHVVENSKCIKSRSNSTIVKTDTGPFWARDHKSSDLDIARYPCPAAPQRFCSLVVGSRNTSRDNIKAVRDHEATLPCIYPGLFSLRGGARFRPRASIWAEGNNVGNKKLCTAKKGSRPASQPASPAGSYPHLTAPLGSEVGTALPDRSILDRLWAALREVACDEAGFLVTAGESFQCRLSLFLPVVVGGGCML